MPPVIPHVTAQLVATLPVHAPWGHWVHVRNGLFVVNTQEAVVAHDFDELLAGRSAPVTFALPAGRRMAGAVSPDRGLAAFPTTHAVRVFGADGRMRWEHRHPCWAYKCGKIHADAAEYAGDEWHRYPDSGSVAFSADGRHVWAHVPVEEYVQEWLVLDAATGEVLARRETGTVAAHGSSHHPHPDPACMGLSLVYQGGDPLVWGRFDGTELHLDHAGDERGLLCVEAPTYLSITDDRRHIAAHRLADGSVLGEVEPPGFEGVAAKDAHGDDEAFWHFDAVLVDADTAVAPTNEGDVDRGINRHWLVDIPSMALTPLRYPEEHGRLVAVGGGRWITIGDGDGVPRVWERMS